MASVQHYPNTAVLAVAAEEAPVVVTSEAIDARLAATYERLGMRPGMLESLAGITERRWWPEGVTFTDVAARAGQRAIDSAGISPQDIGLLVSTSVCRERLEPSAAVDVHHQLGLGASCLNFDVSNACLGFINGMQLAALMIDTGQVEYALIVDGEGSRRTQEVTIERLQRPETTREDVLANFATLTLGSGAAAMVLGRSDQHPTGHRFIGGVARAATEHHQLCLGDLDGMQTDSRQLLEAGVDLAGQTWRAAKQWFDWSDLDCYVIHQVSRIHTDAIVAELGINPERVPITFPTWGNIGPASVPFTLAQVASGLAPGNRVACMGIGSGLNAAVIELIW